MSVDRGRLAATWKLAESCLDHLPQARQPSSTLGTLAGLAPSRLAPCTACGARGRMSGGKPCVGCAPKIGPDLADEFKTRPRHGCQPCPVCDGTGWRRRRVSDPQTDGYTGVEVPAQDKADDISVGAMRRSLAADRERPEAAHDALARATRLIDMHERPESDSFRWEKEWDRMCDHGSYAELAVALEILRGREPRRYSVIWQVVCLQQPFELSEARQAFLNESMTVLTSLMPDRIKVPWWLRDRERAAKTSLWRGRSPAHSRERRERDAEVCRLRAEGASTGQLQRRFALSKSQVNRILANGARADEGSQE